MFRSLLALGFLCVALDAAPVHYLLPDQASDAVQKLQERIASAEHSVTIVTPVLRSKTLRKALERAAGSDRNVTLVTSPEADDDGAYLAQFRNVSLMQLNGLSDDMNTGKLHMTLLLADEKHYCVFTLPLDEEAMKHDVALGLCGNDDATAKNYTKSIKTLQSRARNYLQ